MKQILTLTLITLSFSLSAQKDTIFKSNYYDFSRDTITILSTFDVTAITDTIDAVILTANWGKKTTDWVFVKAVRTGRKGRSIVPCPDNLPGCTILHYGYVEGWDNIEFYDVWDNVLYEGKPVWGKLYKGAVLQYYLKPKQ